MLEKPLRRERVAVFSWANKGFRRFSRAKLRCL